MAERKNEKIVSFKVITGFSDKIEIEQYGIFCGTPNEVINIVKK